MKSIYNKVAIQLNFQRDRHHVGYLINLWCKMMYEPKMDVRFVLSIIDLVETHPNIIKKALY